MLWGCAAPGLERVAQLTPTFELCAKVGVGRSFSGGQCGRGARKAADERLLAIVCLYTRLFLVVLDGFVAEDVDKPANTRGQQGGMWLPVGVERITR